MGSKLNRMRRAQKKTRGEKNRGETGAGVRKPLPFPALFFPSSIFHSRPNFLPASNHPNAWNSLLLCIQSTLSKMDTFGTGTSCPSLRDVHLTGLEITAGQRPMSGLIVNLTGQTFVLPVMLTSQNSIVLKMK